MCKGPCKVPRVLSLEEDEARNVNWNTCNHCMVAVVSRGDPRARWLMAYFAGFVASEQKSRGIRYSKHP